jgi:hypothetical protein
VGVDIRFVASGCSESRRPCPRLRWCARQLFGGTGGAATGWCL